MAGADAVVIGGGAAGIAAARMLHDAGREVIVVEAGDRLGGRAHTIDLAFGGQSFALDAGCGWLHSAERNPWTTLAGRYGLTIDKSSPNWDRQWHDLGFSAREQAAFGSAFDAFDACARVAAQDGPDRVLSECVSADEPWRPMLDAISGYVSGAPMDRVSLHDWAAYDSAASEQNWAVIEGYGTLVSCHAAGLKVRLNTPVRRVEHGGMRLRIVTDAGVLETKAAIVAVPTTALAEEQLRFDPPLPETIAAAAGLPLGLADKVFIGIDGPVEWPAHSHLTGDPHRSITASHRLSPFGWPIIESFYGGLAAEAQIDQAAAFAFVIDELIGLLGSAWRRRLHPLAATRWRDAAHIGGSYSYAKPGHAAARAVLAAPVDDRLFFAGEACHSSDFTTAHGALESGDTAARAVLASTALRR